MNDVSLPPGAPPAERLHEPAAPYRVLARKYRPSSFDDLIGQEAMVRTLRNAFALDRIHQAYLLCGVRGVGKTTTARILARALNYHRPAAGGLAAIDAPTIAMTDLGTHCQAIIESRHVDVIEMDAASHTGIDDVREIIDGSRYRPVAARHKVYIIDEVHMLSKQAFNGLLKTLEEPPGHVKFLFATTEVDKVPVTIRSRCQRFDLRRVEGPTLATHLRGICAREGVGVADEALALIARAAEGSVRDALSLLDQAIAHGGPGGAVDAAAVRLMLGLADRGRTIDLVEQVMRGEVAAALTGLSSLHAEGADAVAVLAGMAEFVHLVTRIKLVPAAADDGALTGEERARGQELARGLSLAVLTRAWQMLSKGIAEARDAPRPLAAADMVLVRLAYAADLPTPDDAIRRLQGLRGEPGGGSLPRPAPAAVLPEAGRSPGLSGAAAGRFSGSAMQAERPAQITLAQPARPPLRTIEELVALAADNRDIQVKTALERDVRLVSLEAGSLQFEAAPGASPQLAGMLTRRLAEWTGQRWMVAVVAGGGAPALRERAEASVQARREELATHPVVARILALFPGSQVVVPQAVAAEAEADAAVEPELPSDDGGTPPLDADEEVVYADQRPDGYGFEDDL